MTKLFVCFWSMLALLCSASWSVGQDGTPGKTWKTLAELSDAEKAQIDLSTDTPRDPQVPYLPAEHFPFAAPYTAEEMGLRSMEFPHTPYWNLTLIDIGITMTNTGFLDQRVSIIPTLYLPNDFLDQLYHIPAGQEVFRWLSQAVAPPERYGTQSLFIGYRTDQQVTTKLDMFAYSPSLRRIRRQPQPRRDDRLANSAQTIDDLIGRDAWEFAWRILGTDTLYNKDTVRFPTTRSSAMLTDDKGGYVEVPASEIKLMGKDYPAYTADGGVPCYVVEAVPKPDWLSNYYVSKLIYWLDQRSFFPLRIEEYDREGKLLLINARIATRANPRLGDRGYAVLFDLWWNLPLDLMTASIHGILNKEWSEDDRKIFFSPGFMRREWFMEPPKNLMGLNSPEEFYLRPNLAMGKFPQERKIEIPPDLAARLEAQEQAGHIVF
ncbi:MAG: DUF1329 domain-containing protein [Deltaproteobacteria bacterium]|nr:DUF1329 domain-containing protein [Deltaproteobacteria bacterium]